MKTKLYVPAELYHCTDMPALPDLTEKDVLVVPDGIISLDHHLEYTGVYHPNGELVVESVLERGVLGGNRETHNKKIKSFQIINSDVLYMGTGYIFQHFGHFLDRRYRTSVAVVIPEISRIKGCCCNPGKAHNTIFCSSDIKRTWCRR